MLRQQCKFWMVVFLLLFWWGRLGGSSHLLYWSLKNLYSCFFFFKSVFTLPDFFSIWSLSYSSPSGPCSHENSLLLTSVMQEMVFWVSSCLFPAPGYFYYHHSTIYTHQWFSHYFVPRWCLCEYIAVFPCLGISAYCSLSSHTQCFKTNWLYNVCGGKGPSRSFASLSYVRMRWIRLREVIWLV